MLSMDSIAIQLRPGGRKRRIQPKTDSLTQSSVREGNRSQLLFDGVESFEARKRLILSATDSVYLQTFIFDDDATGWETARLLSQRAQEGLDVRVIFDGFGSNQADNDIFEFMRASGQSRRVWRPFAAILGPQRPLARKASHCRQSSGH